MIDIIIGTIGMLLLLTAFVLNIAKKLSIKSPAYLILNILGSFLLVYYAFALKSWPFLILELVWAFSALIGLIKIKR